VPRQAPRTTKLSIVRTDECHLDVFTNLAEASAFVKEQSGADPTAAVLATYAVPGSRPVWLVMFVDRGFISGCRGAFLNEDRAVSVAASLEARCEMGLSFSACKFVLDRPARSDAVGGAMYCRAPREDQPGYVAVSGGAPARAAGQAAQALGGGPPPAQASGPDPATRRRILLADAAQRRADGPKNAGGDASTGEDQPAPYVTEVEDEVTARSKATGATIPGVIVVEDDDEPLTPNKADGAVKDREGEGPNKRRRH
jgi:hypothetical protein